MRNNQTTANEEGNKLKIWVNFRKLKLHMIWLNTKRYKTWLNYSQVNFKNELKLKEIEFENLHPKENF